MAHRKVRKDQKSFECGLLKLWLKKIKIKKGTSHFLRSTEGSISV